METPKKPMRLKRSVRALLYAMLLSGGFAAGSVLFSTVFSAPDPIAAASLSAPALNGERGSVYALRRDPAVQSPSVALAASADSEDQPFSPDSPSSDSRAQSDADESVQTVSEEADADTPKAGDEQAVSDRARTSAAEADSEDASLQSAEPASNDLGYPILPAENAIARTVLIDAGHGGSDTGDAASDGTMEKNITLQMAKAIKKHLEIQNPALQVTLLREGDAVEGAASSGGWEDLVTRRQIVDSADPDYFLSLHAHDEDRETGGYSFFINPDDPVASALCSAIETNLEKENWGSAASLTTTDQYPLLLVSTASSHSVQVNLGVPSIAGDLRRLEDETSMDHAAAAIAAALTSTIQDNPDAPGYVSKARQIEQKAQ